mmetsp:Transcript_27596/g.30722  ORF Transcript_27596/g.30722 Transcript_27596/m.30722 type:complete len:667 (-) Transcript_27596:66-2066(-)
MEKTVGIRSFLLVDPSRSLRFRKALLPTDEDWLFLFWLDTEFYRNEVKPKRRKKTLSYIIDIYNTRFTDPAQKVSTDVTSSETNSLNYRFPLLNERWQETVERYNQSKKMSKYRRYPPDMFHEIHGAVETHLQAAFERCMQVDQQEPPRKKSKTSTKTIKQIPEEDLQFLLTKMFSREEGIKFKDRKYLLKQQQPYHAFTGSDAVDWMLRNVYLENDRKKAVSICQRVIDLKSVQFTLTGETKFKDGNAVYKIAKIDQDGQQILGPASPKQYSSPEDKGKDVDIKRAHDTITVQRHVKKPRKRKKHKRRNTITSGSSYDINSFDEASYTSSVMDSRSWGSPDDSSDEATYYSSVMDSFSSRRFEADSSVSVDTSTIESDAQSFSATGSATGRSVPVRNTRTVANTTRIPMLTDASPPSHSIEEDSMSLGLTEVSPGIIRRVVKKPKRNHPRSSTPRKKIKKNRSAASKEESKESVDTNKRVPLPIHHIAKLPRAQSSSALMSNKKDDDVVEDKNTDDSIVDAKKASRRRSTQELSPSASRRTEPRRPRSSRDLRFNIRDNDRDRYRSPKSSKPKSPSSKSSRGSSPSSRSTSKNVRQSVQKDSPRRLKRKAKESSDSKTNDKTNSDDHGHSAIQKSLKTPKKKHNNNSTSMPISNNERHSGESSEV